MPLGFDTMEALRRQHPAWRLLQADSAALVASFLDRVFIQPDRRVVSQSDLAEALEDTLFALREQRGARHVSKEPAGLLERLAITRQQRPALQPWLQQQPRRALALADDWPRLLAFVAWMQVHPRPGLYLRQVDLPGLHSKFIESHRGVLAELLDLALPGSAVDRGAHGVGGFAARHGFRDKPLRVRLRFLDPGHAAWVPCTDADYTLTAAAFAALDAPVQRVFITENEINFLAFPPAAESLVLFGAGYGFDALVKASWLQRRALHYWGDIDTHGFAILDQLRAHFPHARSFLMDHDTLLSHQDQWVTEPQPTQRELPRLDPDERQLYDDLRWRRLRELPLRLEQERIAFGRVLQRVTSVA